MGLHVTNREITGLRSSEDRGEKQSRFYRGLNKGGIIATGVLLELASC